MENTTQAPKGGVFGASLIICGTTIGGGMLALPSVTSEAGFYPAMFSHTLCWLYALITGFFLLEACLRSSQEDTHLPSLAEQHLGKTGKIVVSFLFMFLYECLLISYFSGGVPMLYQIAFQSLDLGASISLGQSFLLAGTFIIFLLFLGNKWIDRLNVVLMVGLFFSFFALISLGHDQVQEKLLNEQNWSQILFPLPVLLGAFGYHNVVPSLVPYLQKNARNLRLAILLGTLIPLGIYGLWQWLILGSLPLENIQTSHKQLGIPIVEAMVSATGVTSIRVLAICFSSFAIFTSLIGVAFSMVDFFADALQVSPHGKHRLSICLLTIAPPLAIAYFNPNIFIKAFGFAAGFGEALLNGLFPILLFWLGSRSLAHVASLRFWLRKVFLWLLIAFTFLVIMLEAQQLLA